MKFLNEYKLPFIVGLLCIALASLFLNITRTNPYGTTTPSGGHHSTTTEYNQMRIE